MRTTPAEHDRLSFVQSLSPEQGVFRALQSEPSTGVMLLASNADLLFANPQAAVLFADAALTAKAWVSLRSVGVDYMPPAWQQDAREIFTRLLQGEQHALLRTIWRGAQICSWATLLEQLPFEVGVLPESATWQGSPLPGPVMLLTSRHVSRSGAQAYFADTTVPIIDARVADLGPLNALTSRELQVLALLGEGGTLSDAARHLHRSEKTVDAHRSAIHAKLGITDRVQLAAISQRLGLTLVDIERLTRAGVLKA